MLTVPPTAAAGRNVGGRPSSGKCNTCRRKVRACGPSCPNWPGLQQTAEVAAAPSLLLTSSGASIPLPATTPASAPDARNLTSPAAEDLSEGLLERDSAARAESAQPTRRASTRTPVPYNPAGQQPEWSMRLQDHKAEALKRKRQIEPALEAAVGNRAVTDPVDEPRGTKLPQRRVFEPGAEAGEGEGGDEQGGGDSGGDEARAAATAGGRVPSTAAPSSPSSLPAQVAVRRSARHGRRRGAAALHLPSARASTRACSSACPAMRTTRRRMERASGT